MFANEQMSLPICALQDKRSAARVPANDLVVARCCPLVLHGLCYSAYDSCIYPLHSYCFCHISRSTQTVSALACAALLSMVV